MDARRPFPSDARLSRPSSAAPQAADDRRSSPRVRTSGLHALPGEVVDVGKGGLRLRIRGRPPEPETLLELTLRHPHGSMPLRARVAWTRRIGFRRHELGCAFERVTPEMAEHLMTVARRAAREGLLSASATSPRTQSDPVNDRRECSPAGCRRCG